MSDVHVNEPVPNKDGLSSPKIKIFIDDEKPTHWYGAEDARVFRTSDDAYKFCCELKYIDVLYLDHDLGRGRTGSAILETLVEQDGVEVRNVVIISLNPSGVERIRKFCEYNNIPCVQHHVPPEVIMTPIPNTD